MRGTAYHRYHKQRKKRQVRKYWGGVFSDDVAMIGKIATTPCMCSCPLCGNPRRHFRKLTLNERRSDIYMKEQLDAVQEVL